MRGWAGRGCGGTEVYEVGPPWGPNPVLPSLCEGGLIVLHCTYNKCFINLPLVMMPV